MKRFAAIFLTLMCLLSFAHAEGADWQEWMAANVTQPLGELFAEETLITTVATVDVAAGNDIAILSFSISAEGETVAEANRQVTDHINTITEILRAQGVEEGDIWHKRYDVSPNVVYHNTKLTNEQVIDGYLVEIVLNVRLKDISLVGVVIDAVMQSGAGSSHELQFEQSGAEDAYEEALAQAAQLAMSKAQKLAGSCGMTLGDLVSVTELSALEDGAAKVEVTYRAK